MTTSSSLKIEEFHAVDSMTAPADVGELKVNMTSPAPSGIGLTSKPVPAQSDADASISFSDVVSGKTRITMGSSVPLENFAHPAGVQSTREQAQQVSNPAQSPQTQLPRPSAPKQADRVLGTSKCSIEELVALEFAEMERMITTSHKKVLHLLGKGDSVEAPCVNAATGDTQGSMSRPLLPFDFPLSSPKGPQVASKLKFAQPGDSQTVQSLPLPGQLVRQLGPAPRTGSASSAVKQSPTLDFGVIKFEILPCWGPKLQDEFTKAALAGTTRGSSEMHAMGLHWSSKQRGSESAEVSLSINFGSDQQYGGRFNLQRFVIHPCSMTRAVWDVVSLALVIYDIAVLPLQFFDPEEDVFTTVMSWVTRLFWSIDLPTTFFTGFLLSDGFIMMKLQAIAYRYAHTWLFLDICLVACDWAEFVISQQSQDSSAGDATGIGRLGKASRIVRILRMIRLLRLARMREVIRLFTFRMTSEKLQIIADIVKCLALIIAVAHLNACLWYGICNSEQSGPESWITLSGADSKPMGFKYMLALHWSLSQFQGGMDEFRAHSFVERFFNVVVFLFAFMMAAVCVSALTSSMTRLHLLTSHQSRQISILRRYLIQTGITDKLAFRVQRNALHAISEQQRLMAESKVELLQAISDPLRVELHFEMYGPVLEVHPFFEAYMVACPHVMHHICHKAMSTLLASNGDIIFNVGEIPESPKMYIVCNGHFDYIYGKDESKDLVAKDFLAEAALWTHWMHRGVLRALMDGRLCVMKCKRFQELVRQFDHPHFDPRNYAIEYVKSLNTRNEEGTLITDLPLGSESIMKDTAQCEKKKQNELRKILTRTKKQADLVASSLMPAPRRMMDSKQSRNSVLFHTDKKARAPKLLRCDEEAMMEGQQSLGEAKAHRNEQPPRRLSFLGNEQPTKRLSFLRGTDRSSHE